MPYTTKCIKAARFMTHKGVAVYHTYKNDDVESGERTNWYSLDPYASEMDGDESIFDVRELNVPSLALLKNHPPFGPKTDAERKAWSDYHKAEPGYMKKIIREALDRGLIPIPENE